MSIESFIAPVAVLALVIFVHELGHFLVAKWCEVEVQVFSIGFGPTVVSRTWGETEYRIAAIPLGGYVRMAGQDDSEDFAPKDPSRGFSVKNLKQRSAIVAAGPAVNFAFAFVVFAGMALFYGQQVPVDEARVRAVLEGAPAAGAGVAAGDTIVSVNGEPIATWEALHESVKTSDGNELQIVLRASDGGERTVAVTPELRDQRDHLGEVIGKGYIIGIERDTERVSSGVFESLQTGALATWGWTKLTFETLGRLMQRRLSFSDLGGPIMIGQVASSRAADGLEPVLHFMAIISINLGVINILPIPVLDGGYLLFFLIEALRGGRPIPVRYREIALHAGIVLILTVMVLVTFNDISRIVTG